MYKFSRPRKWCLNVLARCFSRETLRTFFVEEVRALGGVATLLTVTVMADSEAERTRETARSNTAIN